MDHLPYPEDPVLAPIRVPYVCQNVEQYDGLGFKSFPSRVGWTYNRPNGARVQWHECATITAAKRAQSWLYFGLLREFFGQRFDYQYFVRCDGEDQQLKVCSERLLALGHEWSLLHSVFARQSFVVSSTRYTPYMRMLISLLHRFASNSLARNILGKLEPPLETRFFECLEEVVDQIQFLDSDTTVGSLITVSIVALLWSLQNAITNCEPSVSQNRTKAYPFSNQLLTDRLVSGGVCAYWANLYVERHSVAMINYIAALPRKNRAEDHRNCTLYQCKANDMDEGTYQTKHVKSDCQCVSVGPDPVAVADMIQNDQTPVLQFKQSSQGSIELEVRRVDFEMPYTAISHVWSGGLGNPHQNTLPYCQLERLKEQLQHCQNIARKRKSLWNEEGLIPKMWARYRDRHPKMLGSWFEHLLRYGSRHELPTDPLMFWMDTLCIPVGATHTHVRRKAISKMDFIYSGADNVLVLDPDIQDIVTSNTSLLQRSAHMMLSCWMTRCWTYQEARLARDWVFALSSDLHKPVLDYRRLTDVERCIKLHRVIWNDEKQLQLEAISFVERLWPITDKSIDSGKHDDLADFIRIWKELAERSTSRKGDLHAIFAILLGLNPKEILELKYQDQHGLNKGHMMELHFQVRMKAILRAQHSLPLSLFLVMSSVPKVEDYKNRWMPKFPGGGVTSRYGRLNITSSGNYYTILPSEGSSAFLVQYSACSKDYIRVKDDSSATVYFIRVQIPIREQTPNPELSSKDDILYLLDDHHTAQTSETRTENVGARFLVSQVIEGHTYRLIYDTSITYTVSKEQNCGSSTIEDIDNLSLDSRKLHHDKNLELDCGKQTIKYDTYRLAYATQAWRLGMCPSSTEWLH